MFCLILESGIFFCSPICWILYHVTFSCKGPISYSKLTEKHQTVSEESVTTQGAPTPRICDKSINLPCALLLFCERFLPGLIDRQASRSGFCRSGYRSRRRGLFFIPLGLMIRRIPNRLLERADDSRTKIHRNQNIGRNRSQNTR